MKLVNVHKLIVVLAISVFFSTPSFAQLWSLQQCVDTAQVLNRTLQMAKNDIVLVEQMEREAKANLLPTLMANAEYKYFTNLPYQLLPLSTFNASAPEGQFKEAQFGVPHNIGINLQLTVPLYNAQIYGGIEASKIASEISTLKYQKSKEQIYFEVTNLYYNAQILQTQISFLDSNLINANKLLRNLGLLQDQLLAKGTDVGKVRLQVAQLATQRNGVVSKLEQVLNSLKFVVGIPNEKPFNIDYEIAYNLDVEYDCKVSIDSWLVQAQRRLLDQELRTLNHFRYLPSVNLVGSYGTTGFGYSQEPNSFLNFRPIGFVGLQISYPIFRGTTALRKIDQKQIQISNNTIQQVFVEDQNAMEIANASLRRGTNYETIETSMQQITLAENIYKSTILQQKQGIATLTEALMADNALREAQQTNITAIIDYMRADLELKGLTGNIRRD